MQSLDQVRKTLRKACDGNQARWCAAHGIPTPHVSDVLAGRRKPTPAMLKALGLRRVVDTYEKAP